MDRVQQTPISTKVVTVAILRSIVQLCIGVVLLISALAHIQNPYVFLDAIYGYEIVSRDIGYWFAFFLPFVQLVVGMALLCNQCIYATTLLACGLFVLYVGAQALAIVNSVDADCGCFGAAQSAPVGAASLAITGSFLLLSCWLCKYVNRDASGVTDGSR